MEVERWRGRGEERWRENRGGERVKRMAEMERWRHFVVEERGRGKKIIEKWMRGEEEWMEKDKGRGGRME